MNRSCGNFASGRVKLMHQCQIKEEMATGGIDFTHIGGLSQHIRTLRELIIFPLIYRDIYAKLNIKAPRGVLFYGPPGTGKTLVAKALANECSRNSQVHVSFFNRKGSDILDKWVGESEKKLRALFEKASNARPSVIFFDEIDALAPTRCSRQDQVHASVVATLLALMDGLDSFAGIVVIGATNRLNAIDPALRRSGRFDRELYFPLPCRKDRLEILQVHLKTWTQKPSLQFLRHLADITSGYCGSDLEALCSDAVLCCLKRMYPNIHSSNKININLKLLMVADEDFLTALNTIVPTARKCRIMQYRLSRTIEPLLKRQLEYVHNQLQTTWPHFLETSYQYNYGTERYFGKMLIIGHYGQGHTQHLAPALLHCLEHLPVHTLDMQAMYEAGGRAIEDTIIQKFRSAKQCTPSILYVPNVHSWWEVIDYTAREVLMSLLQELDPESPILLISTSDIPVPDQFNEFFTTRSNLTYHMTNPNINEREAFFAPLFLEKALDSPMKCYKETESGSLTLVPIPGTDQMIRCSRRLRGFDALPVPPIELVERSLNNCKRLRAGGGVGGCRGSSCRHKKCDNYKKNSVKSEYHKSKRPNCIHDAPAVKKRKTVVEDVPATKKSETKLTVKPAENVKSSDVPSTSKPPNVEETVDDEVTEEIILHAPSDADTVLGSVVKIECIGNDSGGENNKTVISNIFDQKPYVDVNISRPKLMALYQRTFRDVTKCANCLNLELLFDTLNTCIQSFKRVWNRNPMLDR